MLCIGTDLAIFEVLTHDGAARLMLALLCSIKFGGIIIIKTDKDKFS